MKSSFRKIILDFKKIKLDFRKLKLDFIFPFATLLNLWFSNSFKVFQVLVL